MVGRHVRHVGQRNVAEVVGFRRNASGGTLRHHDGVSQSDGRVGQFLSGDQHAQLNQQVIAVDPRGRRPERGPHVGNPALECVILPNHQGRPN